MKFSRFAALLRVWAVVMIPLAAPTQTFSGPLPAVAASTEAAIGKGYRDIQNRRYSEAAREFKAALSIHPGLTQARYQLAICEFALGRLEIARREFDRVEKETGASPEVIYYLGRINLQEGYYESAVHNFSEIASSPPFPDTSYYLGSAYLHQDKLQAAERCFRQAAKLNPRDFRIPDHLARVYQKEKRTAEAENQYAHSAKLRQYYDQGAHEATSCGRALEILPVAQARPVCQRLFDPQDPDKLTLLGMIYGRHGDYKDALSVIELASRLDPDSWTVLYNLGLTDFRLHRYSEGLAPLLKATALRPEFFGSSALLGATLYALHRDEAAFQALRHAHQLNPQDTDTQQLLFNESLLLAREQYMKKHYLACLKYLRQAVRLRPGSTRVQDQIVQVERLLGRGPSHPPALK